MPKGGFQLTGILRRSRLPRSRLEGIPVGTLRACAELVLVFASACRRCLRRSLRGQRLGASARPRRLREKPSSAAIPVASAW